MKAKAEPESEVRLKRIEVRNESLKILERNLTACGRIQDLEMINETCFLIWNTSLPFLKREFRKSYFKAFSTAADLLEQIESNESQLRASLHFELTKCYLDDDLLSEADSQLVKALALDYSIPTAKLGIQVKPGEPNINIQYLQRNLDQFLIFLKRSVGVKTNIYSDPQNLIDQLIFETDNIKHAKYDNVKLETLRKCLELIKTFKTEEFDPANYRQHLVIPLNQELVEEEVNELKVKYELKIYDDKKHFTNAATDIAKLAYDLNEYETVFTICDKIAKFEWNTTRDVDQIIKLADLHLFAALSYEDILLNEGIEAAMHDIVNFNDASKVYSEDEKDLHNSYKHKIFEHIREASKLAVSVNQYWLVFNCTTQLWNTLLQVIKAPNFTALCNENAIAVMSEISEALNTSVIYLESINADLFDTDYFSKLEIFINFNSAYAKLLEAKGKPDECIKVCDSVLARKVNSNQRKVFDTIKSRAAKGEKKPVGKAPAAPAGKGAVTAGKISIANYQPTPEQILISECFANLEASLNSKDDKIRYETLKKSMDILKNYKINFNDESTLEINAELWYKIGVQFYALGAASIALNNHGNAVTYFKYALVCADNCVKTFTPADIKALQISKEMFSIVNENNALLLQPQSSRSNSAGAAQENNNNSNNNNNFFKRNTNRDISLALQKWYAVGFLLFGDCINKLVDKEKQERLSQIKLYFIAIEKLIMCAKIAEQCKQFYVILQATKAFYSIIIQIIDQPQNRERLVKLFIEIHKIFVNNRVGILYSDPEFMLLFYSLFCECINEIKDWVLGEQIISEALKILPQSVHHFLLEHKLFYHSKLGKNFLESLNSVDEKDVVTKAKLFAKLARSSKNKADQFKSYNQAIEMLKSDQNIQVVDIIFELSTWLYKNNYAFDDIEDNLTQAADILLEIEPIYEEEDEIDDDGQTLHSKRSTSSRRSKLSKRSRSQRSESKRKSEKNQSKTVKSNKDSRKLSKSRNYSSKNEKTKTVFAKLLDVDPYPLYMNILHLEKLFKIHVFMAMASDDAKKQQDYSMDSFFFLMKVLEISFKTLNCLEFYEKNKDEIQKFSQENLENTNPDMKIDTVTSLVNNYFLTRELNIPEVYTLPENLEGWLTYDFPEFFIKKTSEFSDKTFFNKKSFEKPYQFYYYLKYIIDKFSNEYYFHSQLIPLLKFAILFCDIVLQNQTLKFTFVLQLKRLYHNILEENFAENFINKEIDDKYIPNGVFAQYLMNNEKKTKSREELRKYDINLSTDECFLNDSSEENLGSGTLSVFIVEDLKEHISNLELAKELINHGYYNFAKELLEESIFHCLVLKDKSNYLKANLALAKILFIESEFEKSFEIINRIQAINTDIDIFYEIICEITYILNYLQKHDDLGLFLESSLEFIDSIKSKNANSNGKNKAINNMLINKCISLILLKLAKIKLIKMNNVNSPHEIIEYYNKEITEKLENFSKIISSTGNSIKNIKIILDFCDLSLEFLLNPNFYIHMSENDLNIIKSILESNLNLIASSEKYLTDIQSYTPARLDNSMIFLPVHRLIGLLKIKYCVINNIMGSLNDRILGFIKKKEKISIKNSNSLENNNNNFNINHKSLAKLNSFKDEKESPEENKNKDESFIDPKSGVKFNSAVIQHLNELTKELHRVEKESLGMEHSRFEVSISMLASCASLIPTDSQEYVLFVVEYINSLRLQAACNRELKNIWNPEILVAISDANRQLLEGLAVNENDIFKIQSFHQQTLNMINEFEKKVSEKPKIFNTAIANIKKSKENLIYYNILTETSGYLNIELTFKAISEYQNSFAKNFFSETIEKYLNSSSRDWVALNSLKTALRSFEYSTGSLTYPESLSNLIKYANELPFYKLLINPINWTEIKNILPNNSSYLIFQMTEDRSILYFSYMYFLGGAERKQEFYVKRILLDSEINKQIDNMMTNIKKMKHSLIKSVMITNDDISKAYEQYDIQIKSITDYFQSLFAEVFEDLDKIINPEIRIEDFNATQNDKKAPAAAGKKDPKAPEVNLTLPTSQIESITFLIDYRFYELPFEFIYPFSKIPYKSYDFCLNTLAHRFKANNFNPNTGSSVNIDKSLLKYYLDYSKNNSSKLDPKKSVEAKLTISTGKTDSKPEGLASYEHYPSMPELQKIYSNSSAFIFLSQTALFYQYSPEEFLESSRFSKCRLAIILDRLCCTKNFVNQKSLIPKNFSFSHQPLDLIAILTLTGVSTILTTKWSLDLNEATELLDDVLDESIKMNNFSNCVLKYRNPKKVYENKPNLNAPLNQLADTKTTLKDKGKAQNAKNTQASTQIKIDANATITEEKLVEKKEVLRQAPIVFGLNCTKFS